MSWSKRQLAYPYPIISTQAWEENRFYGEWWVDAQSSVMSYCCLDATPRSFARFGLLFARNGLWIADQVLSEDWVHIALNRQNSMNMDISGGLLAITAFPHWV